MPKYVIPVTYTMYGKYEVEANDVVEALEVIQNPALALPPNAVYVEDSLQVSEEDVIENNDLSEDDQWELSDALAEMYRCRMD
jgi:hypothetical protein